MDYAILRQGCLRLIAGATILGLTCIGSAAPLPDDVVELYVRASRGINLRGKVLTVHPTPNAVRTTTRRVVRRSDGRSLTVFEAPAWQRGVILADDGVWTCRYDPAEHIVRRKRSLEMLNRDADRRLTRLILRNYVPRLEGMETIAGRACYRLCFEPRSRSGLTIRLWVDKTTGAELRRDELDACGSTVCMTLYMSVSFPASLSLAEVTPRYPRKARVVTLSRSAVHADIAQLSKAAGFPVRAPLMTPAGFQFVAGTAATVAGRPSAFLRYTDGLSDITVIETRRSSRANLPSRAARVLARPYGETEVDYVLDDLQVVVVGRGDPRELLATAETMDGNLERRWRQDVERVFNGRSQAVGSMRNRGLTGDVVVALLSVSAQAGKPPQTAVDSYLQGSCWRDLARRWRVPETTVLRQIQTLCGSR